MTDTAYRRHAVRRKDLPDGSILFTSEVPLGPVVDRVTDWLHHWAEATPEAVFVAERSGPGWRELRYGETLDMVRAISASLLDRGMGAETPILIISGNGVDHLLLTLAAQYVGVPVVPVAEQYALIPDARKQLDYVAGLIRPGLVFAGDGGPYGAALDLPCFDGLAKVANVNVPDGVTPFADLLAGQGDVAAANAAVGPDTVAKILMTSGSTSAPKGVLTTHRMMCTNQAQLAATLPFVAERPPRIVDWLPWNHVFGGSHNVNMMLANGGSLYIDDGKPSPQLAPRTIENQRLMTGTIAFNVPVGFAQIRDAMREDADLRRRYFEELDMLFYAGASLPQDVWADLEDMAREVRGEMPLFTSSWGLTETAPAAIIQHEPTTRSGIVGVPMPGLEVKLIPDDENRFEVRLKGPTITPGYFEAPDKTAEAFDADGFFITGDAMAFVEPGNDAMGLRFDGRIAEEFKLLSGTWVRAATLRLDLLIALKGLAMDVILTGADRNEVGLMIVPAPSLRDGAEEVDGVLIVDSAEIVSRLTAANEGKGSSARITRVQVLTEPPSIAEGEITAKGNLNFRKIQSRRAALVDRLYDDADRGTILIGG
jgi:feruloyl-CoA synthase